MKSITEIALQAPVFRTVSKDNVVPLLAKGNTKTAGRGASIHLQGERAHSLYIVLDGWIKLYRMSPCGSVTWRPCKTSSMTPTTLMRQSALVSTLALIWR